MYRIDMPLCISDSQCEMEYIFMMRFLLSDSTGELVANVWRRDAVSICIHVLAFSDNGYIQTAYNLCLTAVWLYHIIIPSHGYQFIHKIIEK